MRIAVIGTGHVGLPTAASLAVQGHQVAGFDANSEVVALIQQGQIPFFEPDLQTLVSEAQGLGNLSFHAAPEEALADARVAFLCVGTPPDATGRANLAATEEAVRMVATHACAPQVVVVQKSTVPIGTGEELRSLLEQSRPGTRLLLASNPEFLSEGSAVQDSLHPSRILVGSESVDALEVMREVYREPIAHGVPFIETNLRTAELAKHAANVFLALKISFANALARVCELGDADVTQIADIMGLDPRIGRGHLDAGLGYGGYCFPKDLAAFRHLTREIGYPFPFLDDIERVNQEAVITIVEKARLALGDLHGRRVALLGLAFKPGTDDLRFAPALALARLLLDEGVTLIGYDPLAGPGAKAQFPEMEIATDPHDALTGADCGIICTEWPELRTLRLDHSRAVMRRPVLIDGRNLLQPNEAVAAGFRYIPTGRNLPPQRPA